MCPKGLPFFDLEEVLCLQNKVRFYPLPRDHIQASTTQVLFDQQIAGMASHESLGEKQAFLDGLIARHQFVPPHPYHAGDIQLAVRRWCCFALQTHARTHVATNKPRPFLHPAALGYLLDQPTGPLD
jgi:hypothetical protein